MQPPKGARQKRPLRELRAVGLRAGMRTFTIVERRGRQTAIWVAWMAAGFAFVAATNLWNGPPELLRLRILLIGIPAVLLTLYYVPWNARLTIDIDARTCRTAYRFFIVPYRSREDALDGRVVAWGAAMAPQRVTVKNEDEGFSALGCLLGMMLGPLIALLMSSGKSGSQETFALRRRSGIVLTGDAAPAELLLPVRDRASVQDALALIAQFAGVRQDVVDAGGGVGIR